MYQQLPRFGCVFHKAYEWTDGGFQKGAADMSNEPTKDTDRWMIKTERITPVFCCLVLSAIASKVYDIGLLVAAMWCLLIFPLWWLGWWLGKRLWERRGGQYEYSQYEYTEVERIYDRCLDYPYSDNWADSLVQLAFYEDGGNADTAGMGGLHQ